MSEDNTNSSETQGTNEEGSETLILGKYKSQEEAFAALEQAERERESLKEALDREQRLNQLLDSVKDEPAPETNYQPESSYDVQGMFDDEDQAKRFQQLLDSREQQIWRRVDSLVEKRVQAAEAQRQATDRFYRSYPELRGFEDRVDKHARELGGELGDRSRNVPFEKLAEEVASRVRKELAETKKKLTTNSLHVEGGSASEPGARSEPKQETAISEDERAAKYFESEVKALDAKRNAPFRAVRS